VQREQRWKEKREQLRQVEDEDALLKRVLELSKQESRRESWKGSPERGVPATRRTAQLRSVVSEEEELELELAMQISKAEAESDGITRDWLLHLSDRAFLEDALRKLQSDMVSQADTLYLLILGVPPASGGASDGMGGRGAQPRQPTAKGRRGGFSTVRRFAILCRSGPRIAWGDSPKRSISWTTPRASFCSTMLSIS
jgi:hypothetical protein